MATARLVASSYSTSSSYATVYSGETNLYENTSNTSYASLRGRNRSSTTAYYIFIKGFNFDSIPSNANVTSFSVKIKCYKNSYQRTGTNYRPKLASSNNINNVIADTTLDEDITTTTGGTVYTIPTGDMTWSTLSDYGSNFSVVIPLSSTSSSRPYVYVYGVEIEVTYTTETIHATGVSVSPSTASVEVGMTTQLTETVSPSNATDKTVTWSSSNTSVATVSNGLVTGVSTGSATITVTTVDGGYTATCTVTVAAAVTYDYKLATSMVVGKKYLIANGNTGVVYLLTNESGGSRQLVGMSVTISNGKISLTSTQKAKAEFECVRYTSGNDNTITVRSDGKYLFTNNSNGLVMSTTSSLDRFWHYRDNKFWQFKSTSSDGYSDTSSEYKYYLELNSSNNFTDNHVTSPSIEDSTLPAIYIFVEDDGSNEPVLYVKNNGTWTQYSKVFLKINGSWVEQDSSTWSTLFNTNTNYRKMN